MDLYLDCASGISGDMLVAALLALGGATPEEPGLLDDVVRPALAAAGIDPRLVRLERVTRGGVSALRFVVAPQRGFASFDELIVAVYASHLEQEVADAVASMAERLAAAEAEVHGREGEHLDELAGIDTAVDLIAAAVLLRRLAPQRVVASPPALGDGVVETRHGRLSVPAPAVLSLLAGLPTAGGGAAASPPAPPPEPVGELTTPTGAVLLAHYVAAFGGLPAGRVEAVGHGAGSREVHDRPNVLRAVLVDPAAAPGDGAAVAQGAAAARGGLLAGASHALLEATIDDMTPELLAHAAEELRAGGALDVWTTPATMKKGRPGVVLHVLVPADLVEALATAVLRETTTFGLRVVPCERRYADERREEVTVGGQRVRVRLGYVAGRLATAAPEYEDVRRAAAALGRPARVVHEAAEALARSRFSSAPGPGD